jgi:DNA-binding transcriptional MerR regulator
MADLVSTGEAAEALGIARRTLSRYAREGRVTPAVVLPGRARDHYRWDVADLRRQLRELGRRK